MRFSFAMFALILACTPQPADVSTAPQTSVSTTADNVFTNPAAYAGQSIRVEAELLGYRIDECRFAPTARSTSLTRSDWLVRQDSYCLYVTGSRFDPALGGERREIRARVVDDGSGRYLLAAE